MKENVVILIRNAAKTDFGGGERVPVFIARQMLHHEHLSPLIFSGSKKLIEFAALNGVTYKKTLWWQRQNWSGHRIVFLPVYLVWQLILFFYYLCLFLKHHPVVVHIQSKDDFIAGTLAGRLLGIPVLWSDYADLKHIFKNHKIWHKNPVGKIVYFCARFAIKIAVVSKEDLRLITQEIPKGKILQKMEVVYNGAFDSYNPENKKNDVFTFISTGRLVIDKGISELIEAFKKFRARHSNSQLYLLGDGPERSRFELQASGEDTIHFLGYQENPLEYVAKSHVFLLPTYHEGFSLALVEACMLGLPIIATNVGGNLEIIVNNKNGILIEPKNATSLLDAMTLLFESKKLRDELAKNARVEYSRRYNFEDIINNSFIKFYESYL